MDLQTQVDIQRTDRGGGRTSTISFCRIAFNSKLRVQSRRALVRFCMLHASLERQNQQGVGEREHCQLFMLHAELAARKSNSAEVGEAEAANDRRPQADNQRPRVGGYHATLPIQLKASATVALHNTATHFAPLKLTSTLGAGCHSSHAQPSTPPGPYWAPAAVHPKPTQPHLATHPTDARMWQATLLSALHMLLASQRGRCCCPPHFLAAASLALMAAYILSTCMAKTGPSTQQH